MIDLALILGVVGIIACCSMFNNYMKHRTALAEIQRAKNSFDEYAKLLRETSQRNLADYDKMMVEIGRIVSLHNRLVNALISKLNLSRDEVEALMHDLRNGK